MKLNLGKKEVRKKRLLKKVGLMIIAFAVVFMSGCLSEKGKNVKESEIVEVADKAVNSKLNKIIIRYKTNWENVYIHYCINNQWTTMPGIKMENDKKYPGYKYIEINSEDAEFVFNDGKNNWDNPYSGKNYYVLKYGEYLVEKGEISEVYKKDKRKFYAGIFYKSNDENITIKYNDLDSKPKTLKMKKSENREGYLYRYIGESSDNIIEIENKTSNKKEIYSLSQSGIYIIEDNSLKIEISDEKLGKNSTFEEKNIEKDFDLEVRSATRNKKMAIFNQMIDNNTFELCVAEEKNVPYYLAFGRYHGKTANIYKEGILLKQKKIVENKGMGVHVSGSFYLLPGKYQIKMTEEEIEEDREEWQINSENKRATGYLVKNNDLKLLTYGGWKSAGYISVSPGYISNGTGSATNSSNFNFWADFISTKNIINAYIKVISSGSTNGQIYSMKSELGVDGKYKYGVDILGVGFETRTYNIGGTTYTQTPQPFSFAVYIENTKVAEYTYDIFKVVNENSVVTSSQFVAGGKYYYCGFDLSTRMQEFVMDKYGYVQRISIPAMSVQHNFYDGYWLKDSVHITNTITEKTMMDIYQVANISINPSKTSIIADNLDRIDFNPILKNVRGEILSKSFSYSISPAIGATIVGNTFKAQTSGTYIVTINIDGISESITINTIKATTPTPTISKGGLFNKTISISINAVSGAEIIYTDDGTMPTLSNGKYIKASAINIPIDKTTTIKCIAVKQDETQSNCVTESYTILLPPSNFKAGIADQINPSKVILSWEKVLEADGYEILKNNDAPIAILKDTVNYNIISDIGIRNIFKIRSYKTVSGTKIYSSESVLNITSSIDILPTRYLVKADGVDSTEFIVDVKINGLKMYQYPNAEVTYYSNNVQLNSPIFTSSNVGIFKITGRTRSGINIPEITIEATNRYTARIELSVTNTSLRDTVSDIVYFNTTVYDQYNQVLEGVTPEFLVNGQTTDKAFLSQVDVQLFNTSYFSVTARVGGVSSETRNISIEKDKIKYADLFFNKTYIPYNTNIKYFYSVYNQFDEPISNVSVSSNVSIVGNELAIRVYDTDIKDTNTQTVRKNINFNFSKNGSLSVEKQVNQENENYCSTYLSNSNFYSALFRYFVAYEALTLVKFKNNNYDYTKLKDGYNRLNSIDLGITDVSVLRKKLLDGLKLITEGTSSSGKINGLSYTSGEDFANSYSYLSTTSVTEIDLNGANTTSEVEFWKKYIKAIRIYSNRIIILLDTYNKYMTDIEKWLQISNLTEEKLNAIMSNLKTQQLSNINVNGILENIEALAGELYRNNLITADSHYIITINALEPQNRLPHEFELAKGYLDKHLSIENIVNFYLNIPEISETDGILLIGMKNVTNATYKVYRRIKDINSDFELRGETSNSIFYDYGDKGTTYEYKYSYKDNSGEYFSVTSEATIKKDRNQFYTNYFAQVEDSYSRMTPEQKQMFWGNINGSAEELAYIMTYAPRIALERNLFGYSTIKRGAYNDFAKQLAATGLTVGARVAIITTAVSAEASIVASITFPPADLLTITALATGGVLMYVYWDEIKAKMNQIKPIWAAYYNATVGASVDDVNKLLQKWFNQISDIALLKTGESPSEYIQSNYEVGGGSAPNPDPNDPNKRFSDEELNKMVEDIMDILDAAQQSIDFNKPGLSAQRRGQEIHTLAEKNIDNSINLKRKYPNCKILIEEAFLKNKNVRGKGCAIPDIVIKKLVNNEWKIVAVLDMKTGKASITKTALAKLKNNITGLTDDMIKALKPLKDR